MFKGRLASVDFFLYTLNKMSTPQKNDPAPMSYFTNLSFKNTVVLEIPLSSQKCDNVSIVTTVCTTMFEPAIFIHRKSGPHCLVTVMLVHISIIST